MRAPLSIFESISVSFTLTSSNVVPYTAQRFIYVDGMTMDEDGGHLIPYGSTETYNGKPKIKMMSFASLSEEILKTQPIKILFYDSENKILLAIECILNE